MSKQRFHVVYCSSEDSDHPVDELNLHGPNTKGWQSAKFSNFPLEIIVELDNGECRISQIQLLSHQSKISSKIEIFIGSGFSFESATYKRLGYLSLDPNEKSNYQARELKTVYIDSVGKYLKFLVHKNHVNNYNMFNQVGIVAINLVGTELEAKASERRQPPVSNTINDLALDMNLDPQTTAKLRQLSEAKSRAVAAEDYITAKKIKAVENDLKELGTRLAQIEISKRKAVEKEDYDRAKELKDECDALRQEIEVKISSINIPGVTDNRLPSQRLPAQGYATFEAPMKRKESIRRPIDQDDLPMSDSAVEAKEPFSVGKSVRNQSVAVAPSNDEDQDYQDDNADDLRPIRPKAQMNYDDPDPENYDESSIAKERFLPGQHPLEGADHFNDLPTPESLVPSKEKELTESGVLDLIGEYRSRCLMSKVWNLRSAVLQKTALLLPEFKDDPGMNSCFPALLSIIRVGVEDKLQQVFVDGLALLEAVIRNSSSARLSRAVIGPVLDPVIVSLIEKTSDSNLRIKEGAKRGLDLLLHSSVVGPSFISPHALKTLNPKQLGNWKVILSRLKLLTDIVSDGGFGTSTALSSESVMNFCKSVEAFTHGNNEVREAAKELTKVTQKIVGTSALDIYLAELRPKQLKEYLAAFGDEKYVVGGEGGKVAQTGTEKNAKKPAASASTTSPKGGKTSNTMLATPAKQTDQKATAQPKNLGPASPPAKSEPKATTSNPPNDAGQNFTVCMFCGASDKRWDEEALDLHFWKSCPLLTPCPACAQVVEIAGLPEHLLDECDHKDNYVPCETTGLAIKKSEYDGWVKSKNCKLPPENCIYCPLCLSSVEDSDEAWKQHLVHGCPKNNRSKSN